MPDIEGVKLSAKAKGLINRLEEAAVGESWKGSARPEEHDGITRRYEHARFKIADYIAQLESK